MSLGTRVMQVRTQKGLTQRRVSERSGIASSYLSRIENRHLEPSPKTLRKIADALGVPVSDFFQERPGARPESIQCVITTSGHCVMDLLRARRGRPPLPGTESYNPRQLQLLRMAGYLIGGGDGRLLDALEVMFEAMLNAGRKTKPHPLAGAAESPRAQPAP